MNSAALQYRGDDFAQWHVRPRVPVVNVQTRRELRQQHSANDLTSEYPDTLQNSSPHQHPQHGVDGAEMRSSVFPRNIDALRTDVETRLVAAFTDAAPQYQVVAKSFAPTIGASAATIESYRQRFPQAAINLVMIGRALPMFGLHVMDAMGIDIDADRTAYSQFLELQNRIRGR